MSILQNINLVQRALDASVLRHNAISNNIANVNTPNYKPQKVIFEDILKQELSGAGFDGKRTNAKHIPIGIAASSKPLVTQEPTVMQNSGNGVDMDSEMTELTKNSIWYQTLSYQISEEFNLLKTAIKSR
ncbi:flagellar basal body rod protein FlgB [Neobacillus sp. SAB-20_R2A]|uniref:flagellar basal body rod protein FlgB n=1 Tax=Neobacillus sp. SAB-20_R2A TaxID=3120519 RepID=UPI003C6E25BF